MTGEFDIAGVFIPAILIWAIVSMVIGVAVRTILRSVGFYRLVWHRGLFDLALFFILWGLVASIANSSGMFAGMGG